MSAFSWASKLPAFARVAHPVNVAIRPFVTMSGAWLRLIEVRFPDYASYVDHMSRDGSWGGDLVLQSCAALFMRPVCVVSAESEEHEGIR